jgi:hypothetical protein
MSSSDTRDHETALDEFDEALCRIISGAQTGAEQIVGRERRGPLNFGIRISDCGFEIALPRQLRRWAVLQEI